MEELEEYEFDDEFTGNMPCDNYGPCACTPSCPKYWECNP